MKMHWMARAVLAAWMAAGIGAAAQMTPPAKAMAPFVHFADRNRGGKGDDVHGGRAGGDAAEDGLGA